MKTLVRLVVFAWLGCTYEYSLAVDNPFDGMSAVEVAVNAAMKRSSSESFVQNPDNLTSNDQNLRVQFVDFMMFETKGRPAHEGEFSIPGMPVADTQDVAATLLGIWETAQFSLVDEAGGLIQEIDLTVVENDETRTSLTGTIAVPDQQFRVRVVGQDQLGIPYDILYHELFGKSTVELRFIIEYADVSAGPHIVQARVFNHGETTETFTITAVNDNDLPIEVSPSQLTLEPSEVGETSINIDIPRISSGFLQTIIEASVYSQTNSSIQNTAQAIRATERFERIHSDGYEQPIIIGEEGQ